MKYTYSGMVNAGKMLVEHNFWINNLPTVYFRPSRINSMYATDRISKQGNPIYDFIIWYKKEGSNTIQSKHNDYHIKFNEDKTSASQIWHYQPLWNFILEDERVDKINLRENLWDKFHFPEPIEDPDESFYEKYKELNLYELIEKVFNDSDLIMNPYHCLGYKDGVSEFFPDIIFDFKKDYIKLMQNCANYLPYKENILDCLISLLNITPFIDDPQYKTGLKETYETSKLKVWKILDFRIKEARCLEMIYKSNNIPYEYFNLDRDQYTDKFGLDKQEPSNFTHGTWNYDSDKYKFIENVVKEYISLRNIKDLRLSGSDIDGLTVL